jgi:hypothetical protein
MKVRNINVLGEILNVDIRQEPIGAGEVVEVDDELGARLLEQKANWEPVGKAAKETAKEIAVVESPRPEPAEPTA